MNKSKFVAIGVLLVMAIVFVMTTCFRGGKKDKAKDLPPGTHAVTVVDITQTSNYTYLQVEENDAKFWIAVVKRDAKKGDVIYYKQAMEMKNFASRELGKTFPSVYFVQDPSDKLIVPVKPEAPQAMTPKKAEIIRRTDISVKVPQGGISIAELYKNRDKYAGKPIVVRGVITKYNDKIMQKNWVHIQDGTDFSGKFDLAVTTSDSLTVGATVTFRGIIALNRDFGAGYVYEIIMEQAKSGDITR